MQHRIETSQGEEEARGCRGERRARVGEKLSRIAWGFLGNPKEAEKLLPKRGEIHKPHVSCSPGLGKIPLLRAWISALLSSLQQNQKLT